jgi:hypothetical protein
VYRHLNACCGVSHVATYFYDKQNLTRPLRTPPRYGTSKLQKFFYKLLTLFLWQGHQIFKTVFVAFFQGEQLKSRVRKVCAGFHASVYPCPSQADERAATLQGVRTRLADLSMVNPIILCIIFFYITMVPTNQINFICSGIAILLMGCGVCAHGGNLLGKN